VGSSSTGTVAERWHAGWKLLHPRNPSGAVDSQLAGISCPNTHTCVAVGSYRTSPGGYPFTLAERWNGHRWRIQHTPNPRGANGASAFGAVSCPTVGTCFAVGGSYTSSGEGVTLVERWHNGTWTIQHRPKKAHASDIHLQDVSCSSTTACTAVGYFAGAPRGEGTLVERWNGQRWVVQASPNPPNPAPSLDGVSCRNRTTCMAVGYFSVVTSISPSGRYHYKYSTLAELWDGHRWTLQRPPNPAKGTGPGLDGVACPTLSGCFSAGHYYPAKHHNAIWPLAERWQAS
jgi:hypothetical protein